MARLADRVAVITGAGSGIGRAAAELFAAEGARIAAVDRDGASLERLAGAARAAGRTVQSFEADVADEAAAGRVVAETLAAWGRLDVLVTCAAISVGGTAVATPAEAWDRVFAVNARGTYLWIRAVLPPMIARRSGSIITVASQMAVAGGRATSRTPPRRAP